MSTISDPVLVKGSKKGRYILLYKGFSFTRRSKSKKGVVWKCIASKTDECTSTLTTDPNLNLVLTKGEHNHKRPDEQSKPKHIFFMTP